MPLEQTTTKLESITSKSGTKKDGDPWMRYDFKFESFKKPWSTFNADLFDPSLQGKMVRASGSAEERTFTGDSGSPITYTQYTLQNIELVEGESGSLNDVMAPIAARENDQAVATQFTNDAATPQSPSDAAKNAQINRAVAFKGAIEVTVARLGAGEDVGDNDVLQRTNSYQQILESR